LVQQFDTNGRFVRSISVPQAFAITTQMIGGQEHVTVIGSRRHMVVNQGWVWLGGDKVFRIRIGGSTAEPVLLTRPLTQIADMTSDAAGNLYMVAAVSQVYKFDFAGKLLKAIGAGTDTRAEDGRELLHTVSVDSKGNIYTMGWGNPGKVIKFDANVTSITLRAGQFKWADPWSIHGSYTPLTVDRNDRLWVGATNIHDPNGTHYNTYHFSPCVLRTQPDYLDPSKKEVEVRSGLTLGLSASITTQLPYDIAYDLNAIPVDFVIAPAIRELSNVSVSYRVHDALRNEVARGNFDLALQNGIAARKALSFTPPRWGWYTFIYEISSQGQLLQSFGKHIGVTPRYDGMISLAAGESGGNWADISRHAFAGLSTVRLDAEAGGAVHMDTLDRQLTQAARYGSKVFVQFTYLKDCTPENVRAYVERFKGRVKYWEIMNEPYFSMSVDQYVAMVKQLTPLIKSIDPNAQVMGPALPGILLPWVRDFYRLGGGPFVDILSFHDYEGHESIDEVHWRWKFDELRKIMAQYGDSNKAIWQTERAITAVRGGNFMGLAQAIRTTLHRDVLETLGVAPEHNSLYYLNQGGYPEVPSYLWSDSGPHAAIMALRTRHAQTQARGRSYAGTLDFGPDGNKIFLGLRYNGGRRLPIVLRNLGTVEQWLKVAVSGGSSLQVMDAFGNIQSGRGAERSGGAIGDADAAVSAAVAGAECDSPADQPGHQHRSSGELQLHRREPRQHVAAQQRCYRSVPRQRGIWRHGWWADLDG
jgi:hypothetical protein